ncbi:MAG: phage portal protein [Planctomycetota bacterium]|jgi:lambda family phage portal protein
MAVLDRLLPGRRRASRKPIRRRSYDAANQGRLYASWLSPTTSSTAELRQALKIIRNRSRLLEQNNPYAKRFIRLCKVNIAGPRGVQFRSRARDDNGQLDEAANGVIEESFRRWGRKGNCTVCGRFAWPQVQKLIAATCPRDGEVLVRMVRGFDNEHRFALQLLEADHLEENLSKRFPDGRLIIMGVEVDRWRRPIAYHVRRDHPGDDFRTFGNHFIDRVPASDIVHPYLAERPEQLRGVPWMHAGMARMQMLGGYEEAELVAARAGAAKMGFYKTQTGAEMTGPEVDDPEESESYDAEGNLLEEFTPAHMTELPKDIEVDLFDPDHPSTAFGAFTKTMLRGLAASFNVSYPSLAQDPESINFNSLRHFAVEERDSWRELQAWLVTDTLAPIYTAWLEMQLTLGTLGLPMRKLEKFVAGAQWRPRGWQWVSPKDESKANREQVAMATKSLTQVCEETTGRDYEDVLEERRAEIELAESKGVPIDLGGTTDDDEGNRVEIKSTEEGDE